jgi:hypothetical protein
VTSGDAAPPTITEVYTSGTNLIFSGTGGVQGNGYTVISTTNVALPSSNWTPVSSSVFGPGGTFSVTNAIDPAKTVNLFRLRVP